MDLREEIIRDLILALQKTKGEHRLSDKEISDFSSLMATVAVSSPEIRAMFYLGVSDIAINIQKILKIQEEELLKEIASKKKDNGNKILN